MCTSDWVKPKASVLKGIFGRWIKDVFAITFRALSSPHMCPFSICTFSPPLYASIWLKFWPRWVAWILCLCPTFPLVRLGHKGSTSAIVTAGSSGCVPQTGWSRKLAFLREYSVGGLKMFLLSPHREPPDVTHTAIVRITVQTCIFTRAHPGKGTLSGTILSRRCFLQS